MELRLAQTSDIEQLLQLKKENRFYQFYEQAPPMGFSDEQEMDLLEKAIKKANDIKGIYVIEDNKEILGSCSIENNLYRNAYTFIYFNPKRDLELSLKQTIFHQFLKLLFQELNYVKVNVYVRGSAEKERDFYLGMGFCEEVCLREHYYEKGYYEAIYHLGLTKNDYKKGVISSIKTPSTMGVRVEDKDDTLVTLVPPKKQLLFGKKVDLVVLSEAYAQRLYHTSKFYDAKNTGSVSAAAPMPLKEFLRLSDHNNDLYTFSSGLIFGIKIKEGDVIGTIGGQMVDLRNRHVMLGITIYDQSHRGKGYGSEAIQLFTDFVFLEMNMHRLYLGGFSFNTEAVGLYEHLGFQLEGINRCFIYRNGNYYDEHFFGITRQEWLALRGYI